MHTLTTNLVRGLAALALGVWTAAGESADPTLHATDLPRGLFDCSPQPQCFAAMPLTTRRIARIPAGDLFTVRCAGADCGAWWRKSAPAASAHYSRLPGSTNFLAMTMCGWTSAACPQGHIRAYACARRSMGTPWRCASSPSPIIITDSTECARYISSMGSSVAPRRSATRPRSRPCTAGAWERATHLVAGAWARVVLTEASPWPGRVPPDLVEGALTRRAGSSHNPKLFFCFRGP